MKYVLMSPFEEKSDRFDRLCEALEHDETRDQRNIVFAHLIRWFYRWAGDPELDHGLFWSVSEKRMGMWADWTASSYVLFGRALVKAGYVRAVDNVLPAQLVVGRQGYIAMAPDGKSTMLDLSWDGHHRKDVASDLYVYLSDRQRRACAAQSGRYPPPRSKLPKGWLDHPAVAGPPQGPPGGQEIPESFRKDSGTGPAAAPPAPPPGRLLDVKKRESKDSTSNVTGRTGKPKTGEQYQLLCAQKYDNPLACLIALDESPDAVGLWHEAVQRDVGHVCTLLANMVETPDAWRRIANPAAVAMRNLLPHVRKLRRQTGRNDADRRPGGGAGGL